MTTKLKRILMDKMLPLAENRETVLKAVNNIHISYEHSESCFIVNMMNMAIPKFEVSIKDNLPPQIKVKENNPNQLKLYVDRATFIEEVLRDPVDKIPQLYTEPKKVVIDFSSPNIAKPFHAGHLRSTIIGNFIANINKYLNNSVTKINYLGDWGTQFGLLKYGLQEKDINPEKLQNNAIKTLYDAYVFANKLAATDETIQQKARQYFADIEQGNTSLGNWKLIREVTLQELEKIYSRLGIYFDAYHWESDYNGGAIKDLITLLENHKIIRSDESGKKVATINNRDVTILKSDQSTLYISRDVAALIDRFMRYKFDKMLYVVDNSQTDHFMAVFEIAKKINPDCANGCEHIKFGRIRGMSTRTGNVIFLNDILDEAQRKMQEKQQASRNTRDTAKNRKTCDILGTTAVIINDLKQRRQKDYTFSWEKALQSEGDSGIKLQYLHCRLWSLEQNCGVLLPHVCDPGYVPEQIVGEVVAELSRFDNVLQRAYAENEACILVNYLFRLAKYVNKMFNELKVKDINPNIAAQRLLVFHSARQVVKTGLEILGVQPLHEM